MKVPQHVISSKAEKSHSFACLQVKLNVSKIHTQKYNNFNSYFNKKEYSKKEYSSIKSIFLQIKNTELF